jgi:hypothetical protein
MTSNVYVYKLEYISILMQTLEFAKKSTSKNQKTEQVEELEKRREERIEGLISSRRMFRVENSDVFYVESSKSNIYHYCKINFTTSFKFCSCEGFKFRRTRCCHLDIIPKGIMKNAIIDVQKLPAEVKIYHSNIDNDNSYSVATIPTKKHVCNVDKLPYTKGDYTF